MKRFIIICLSTFIFSCKSNKTIDPTPTTPTTNNNLVYGGIQKDNQYLSKIIGEYKNYTYLQRDSLLLTYNKAKQLISSINYQSRTGSSQNTNGFIKKTETNFNYDSKGNLTDCKTTDFQYQYTHTFKFEYDDKNQLYKINIASQTGSYSESIIKIESTDKGFNQFRNGFLKVENSIVDGNLNKYFDIDSPITFDYQGYKTDKMSPFFALPQNMQKVFFSTENSAYFFLLTLEELNCISKNVPSKIVISGAMNSTNDIVTNTNVMGYVTELSIGDISTSVYKKYRFSYNDK